ncbi:S-layer protein precursor [Mesobacillus boroniphilus JCM 21738]|uniref:S-layer protein n=2 Tax=Mesobacillus boroniphilus TaxID=308892 RepID=W4RWP8_9BACI|nr:S-layer protein precursor [Mesobacillus boroniphilus JCM 21738]
MKKKAFKVATASAIAASAFVAAAPAQTDAASNVAVEVSKAVTQMKKAYHTYSDITASGEFQDLTVVYKEYNAAKVAYNNAKALVKQAGGSMQAAYEAQLDVTYNDYIAKRVITYIDAYNYAVTLDAKRESLEAALTAKNWDAAEKLYHEISYELKTRTVILDRVYGKTTRELLRGEFKADAQDARDSIAVEVTVKMALDVAAKELAEKDLSAAKAALDKAAECW